MGEYFNFRTYNAGDWWSRRAFLARWWQVNARDRRWVPQNHAALYDAIVRRSVDAVARFSPMPVTLEAMVRRNQTGAFSSSILSGPTGEQCIGIMAPLVDERGEEPVVWLAMFNVANDVDMVERMMGLAYEAYPGAEVVAPATLTPRLAGGVLLDHFHRDPPINSPYNPPYVAELLEGVLEPFAYDRMWVLDLSALPEGDVCACDVRVEPVSASRLCGDLYPLLARAWDARIGDPPDAAEVAFALRLWQGAALRAWCAFAGSEPAGYALAQADAGRAMRRVAGGRTVQGRLWQSLRGPLAGTAGRVLLGGVAPEHRTASVGRSLAAALLDHARRMRWTELAIGPVRENSLVEPFLARFGAFPRQRYARYSSSSGR